MVGEAFGVHVDDHALDELALLLGAPREAPALRVEAEGHEVARAHRHVGIEQYLLGHVAEGTVVARERLAQDADLTGVGTLQTQDGAQQRGLTDAVRTDEPGELAAAHLERDIVEDRAAREGDRDAVDLEHGRVAHSLTVDVWWATAAWIASTSASIQV